MEKQIAAQKELQTEMGQKSRQAMLSMQYGIGKERMNYLSLFVGTYLLIAPAAYHKTHNPAVFAPFVPLSILWTFNYDLYYGNMQIRIQKEASRLMREEPERFFLPEGTGIIDQKGYNKIVGIPENYQPKLKTSRWRNELSVQLLI